MFWAIVLVFVFQGETEWQTVHRIGPDGEMAKFATKAVCEKVLAEDKANLTFEGIEIKEWKCVKQDPQKNGV